jgi:hypothetical protein
LSGWAGFWIGLGLIFIGGGIQTVGQSISHLANQYREAQRFK